MRASLAVSGAFVLACTIAALADPVGDYAVAGTNPGGSGPYSGTVKVEQTGDTYRVTWAIGGTITTGTGVGDKNFLAVSYTTGKSSGLALYGVDGSGWKGIWTYANGTKLGAEAWTRK